MHMHMKRILAAIVTLLAILVFASTLVHALYYAPESEIAIPAGIASSTPAAQASPDAQPARLRIPSLGIDASVQYVGITTAGNMGVPNNFTDVAWYKYGTLPGQVGSAVIDGHVDNGLALAGVFKHLADIKTGADVYVVTKDGTKLRFIVESAQAYPYKSVPTTLLFNRKDKARLNLVTCSGSWVKGDKTYDERLVVYTVLAS
ncbi:MAG: peptidase sortase [Candidatus Kaiserbacteria bacterium]|nr:peptidase sortase [Candidatus Kaiserbacteria bacterium]